MVTVSFVADTTRKDMKAIAGLELFLKGQNIMGRKRLFDRDGEILSRYCQQYTTALICRKFHITRSQIAKIIRRAAAEGFQFKTKDPEPWGTAKNPQLDLF